MALAVLLFAQLAQHFKAVHARHHDVQNGHIQSRTAVFENIQRFFAVGGLHNGVAVPLEEVAYQTADTRLVVCN